VLGGRVVRVVPKARRTTTIAAATISPVIPEVQVGDAQYPVQERGY